MSINPTVLNLGGLALLIALVAISRALRRGATREPTLSAHARPPLTRHEQAMYFRLTQSFPNLIVLAQVSFSALMTTSSFAQRNRFNRKTADFVICDRSFAVITVIELDDSSHDGRQDQDASRDALLAAVGIPTLRCREIPNIEHIKREVAQIMIKRTDA